jgi:hypothetical protein
VAPTFGPNGARTLRSDAAERQLVLGHSLGSAISAAAPVVLH